MKHHTMHHIYHKDSDDLGELLGACGHFLAHRRGGPKRGQDAILAIIAQQPGITQKGLTEILGIQPASVSELLMKLERKGLVSREKNETDHRSICVFLTDTGSQLLQQPESDSVDPFAVLTQEEQVQLRTLLQKLLSDWSAHIHKNHHRHDHKHKKHDHSGGTL